MIATAVPGGPRRYFFEDTLLLFRAVRSRAGAGYTLISIGETWRSDGDYEAAGEAMSRALEVFRELEADQGASVALNALGNLARSTGEHRTRPRATSRRRSPCAAPRAIRATSPRR